MARFFLITAFLLPLALPSVAFAQGLVPCGSTYYDKQQAETETQKAIDFNETNANAIKAGTVIAQKPVFEGEVKNPCGFGHIITLSSAVINWLISIGVIIATMGFAYAGFLYITAAGSEEKIKHAHSIFVKVLIGFTLMLGAWLIAKAFETEFLNEAAKARSFLAN